MLKAPSCRDLGFALGPRINAGGRVGKADLGVRLLTTSDPEEARGIAAELDRLNEERRAIEMQVCEQALEQADKLSQQIADLNRTIAVTEAGTGIATNLRDQRGVFQTAHAMPNPIRRWGSDAGRAAYFARASAAMLLVQRLRTVRSATSVRSR